MNADIVALNVPNVRSLSGRSIHLTSLAEKSAIQIGHAIWIKENCVPLTDGMECGNCARHCPTGAIQMVASDPDKSGFSKNSGSECRKCIGCGACEKPFVRPVLSAPFM